MKAHEKRDLLEILPDHFRLAPSSASRWLECPGSARTDLPDTESEASWEGTIAHALGSSKLTGEPMPDAEARGLEDLDEDKIDEVVQGVKVYVDFVRTLPADEVLVEYRSASRLVPEHGGTTDYAAITADAIHVVDLKFGYYYVPAENNKQLMSYLNLLRERYPGRERFRGTIVQPRISDPVRTAEFTLADLDLHRSLCLEAAFDDRIVAGKHCTFCPLLLNCETAYRQSIETAMLDFQELDELPSDDPALVEKLLAIVEMAPVIAKMAEQALDKMVELMERGTEVPGYKAVQGFKRRAWRDAAEARAILEKRYPKIAHQFVRTKLKTPAQIEKLIPKSVLAELDLAHRPTGPIKAVPAYHKGESIEFGDDFED